MKRKGSATSRALVVVAVAVLAVAAAGGVGASPAAPVASIKAMLTSIAKDARATRLAVTDKSTGLREIKREVKLIQAASDRLDVSAEVNEAACASGPVQCGDGATGHTFSAPSSSNHNPIVIAVLVALNGAPVTGVPSANFDFSNKFVPAGGPGMTRCPAGGTGCASPANLFQDGGDGTYQLWVHPAPTGNWKAGTYFGRITVTDTAGHKGSALVEVDIP